MVTNQGQNTKYHTDAKHPHRLYYDDFDENGVMDLVEAEYEGDTEFPVRGRSCSSCALPMIADKFETYHDFATASLSDIYDSDIKQGPFREVTNLNTSIFWNEGDHFRLETLPDLVQISPSFGSAIADFDGDGHTDILIANNFFPNQPETGFNDGGVSWFLKGDGEGKFDPLWPNQSGVVLQNDSNGLATADFDLDGDLDALVGVNDEHAQLLTLPESNDALRLTIIGPKSNRNSIGARIEFVGSDSKRTIAIAAGESYMSQSFGESIALSKATLERFNQVRITWPDGQTTELDLAAAFASNTTAEASYPE